MPAFTSELKNNKVTITASNGQSTTSDSIELLFDWLLSQQDKKWSSVCWDVDEFSAPLFKVMPVKLLRSLFHTGKAWVEDYYIFYNKTSLCVGERTGRKAIIYNLKQYFNGATPPKNAQETLAMYRDMYKELKGIGLDVGKLTSPVTMIEAHIYNLNLPTHKVIPFEVNQMAYKCSTKRWHEAIKIGHWDKTWDIDLTSAFPAAMADMIDCSPANGVWVDDKVQPKDAVIGFAQGTLRIEKDISPVVYIDKYGNQINHKGEAPFIIAKPELDIIREFGIGDMAIERGYWFVPNNEIYPARDFIQWLYTQRDKSAFLNYVAKSSMVGMYGKLLQLFKDDTANPFFNPVWASTIESMVRAKDTRFIYSNHLEDDVLHIATDGVLLDKEVDITTEKRFGEWRLNGVSPSLIMSSNLVFTGDKKPNRLLYEMALKMIGDNPQERLWTTSQTRRMTLGDYVINPALGLGSEHEVVASFGLKVIREQHDRNFNRLPLNGAELLANRYDSKPWDATELAEGDNV